MGLSSYLMAEIQPGPPRQLPRFRRIVMPFVIAAGLLYAVFLSLLYFNQGSILYPGTSNRVDPVPPHAEGAEVLKVATAAGAVDAIFLPATDGAAAAPKPLVIYGHGNGEVIDYWLTGLQGFRDRGIGVLLVEYPGYGRSSGSPSEVSIRAAMDAAYDRIATDPRVDSARIFGFGQSLGSGAICLLAKDRPLRALILQSAFPSLDMFAAGYWAPAFLLRDHFDNASAVRQFPGPVLVIHGRQDRLIPWQQGQLLASASPRATFRLYDCGHGCWDPDHLPFWRDATPFLRQAGLL
jgi:pimeloyl-ACP methyl ester carboxylesterase